MRDFILNLINTKPKHYAKMVKNNPKLIAWVKENTLVDGDHLPSMIYSALYQVSNICPYGKVKPLPRISLGFIGCGPANVCQCTKESIAENVKETKGKWTQEQRDFINTKRENTMIERFGVAFNSQRPEIHDIWKKPKVPADVYEKLNDYNWLYTEYVVNQRSAVDIAQDLNIWYGTVIDYCIKHNFSIRQRSNYSLTELDICKFLDSLNVKYEHSNWSVIKKELDIYIPDKKLAIEIDGLYWHSYHPSSTRAENKARHIEKTRLAQEQGIELLHITDWEWTNKNDIVKSIIKSKLGLNDRIFARNCELRIVKAHDEKKFLNDYHLQGYIPSKLAIGLYFNNELVSLMSIGKTRFSNLADYEILRFCTKSNLTVVGGGSKILKEIRKNYPILVTYCDLSKSNGNGYVQMGFTHIKDTGPGYFWTDGDNVISRFKAQKNQLKKWLKNYDNKLSESENMFASKYRRFHDCGNSVFLLK